MLVSARATVDGKSRCPRVRYANRILHGTDQFKSPTLDANLFLNRMTVVVANIQTHGTSERSTASP